MAYGVSNGHVNDDVTRPQMCCEEERSAILATAWPWLLVVFTDVAAHTHSRLYALSEYRQRSLYTHFSDY